MSSFSLLGILMAHGSIWLQVDACINANTIQNDSYGDACNLRKET